MHFAITIAAALAATVPSNPSFDDALLGIRVDCAVTATIHRDGTAAPYGNNEYIFLFAHEPDERAASIPFIQTVADDRSFLRTATIETAAGTPDAPFPMTLRTQRGERIELSPVRPGSTGAIRFHGSFALRDENGRIEQEGQCRARYGPPVIRVPPP